MQHCNLLCLPENYQMKYYFYHGLSWPQVGSFWIWEGGGETSGRGKYKPSGLKRNGQGHKTPGGSYGPARPQVFSVDGEQGQMQRRWLKGV
jgi:hypothetical protein